MSAPTRLMMDPFDLELRDIATVEIEQLHALSISVRWPHRPDDWRRVIEVGEGIAAVDEIGRVLGSAMWFRQGPHFTMIGMMITSPRLQAHGAGRWLMRHVLERGDAPSFGLVATRAAHRLYVGLGFRALGAVHQCQGTVDRAVAPGDAPDGILRPTTPADHAAIVALDAAASGVDRSAVLRNLSAVSEGVVLERHGAIVAFALCRAFGRGHVVGPVIAAGEGDAIAVVRAHLEGRVGSFVRVDTPEISGAFARDLAACGLPVFDVVTPMRLGEEMPPPPGPARIFGLASQATG